MSIKKILFFSILIISIPFIIVNLFIKKEEITFNYTSNKMVRVKKDDTGEIIKVPLEEYVYGVVSSEMPASFNEEALKAQAVASRTYVMYAMENSKNRDFDVYDSVNSQVYKSEDKLKEFWGDKYEEYSNKIKKVIIDTKGEYITYNDEIIEAFFFSTSTGYTENSEEVFNEELPYLRSVESAWDESSPSFNSEIEISKNDFYNKLGIVYNDNLDISDIEKTGSGRIKSLKINGNYFKGVDVRTKLGLRSTFFTFYENEEKIKVKTKGYGHGVGMSQYGAQGMALAGFKYEDIIKYYYTGVEIKKIDN